MAINLSPAENLAYSTVRIEVTLPDGKIGTGTGFFYGLSKREGGLQIPVIVTNKHVIAEAVTGRFKLTLAAADGTPDRLRHHTFEVPSFETMDTAPDGITDLCIFLLGPLLHEAASLNRRFFFVPFGESLLPSQSDLEDMIGIDQVTMVGYPSGLWDQVNNLPIFRRGVMASHPLYDWNGKPEFLIDAACFRGSSGSPVLLFDMQGYRTKTKHLLDGMRIKLLGILYAGPQQTVTGEIKIVTVPTVQVPMAHSQIPVNLGIVIKSSKLQDFEGVVAPFSPSLPTSTMTIS